MVSRLTIFYARKIAHKIYPQQDYSVRERVEKSRHTLCVRARVFTHSRAIPALRTADETALIAVSKAFKRVVNSPVASL